MRIGVISDVHANHPALQTVLDDMPTVDRIVCAGDVVGYYPWPAECVAAVRERDIPCVQGNHDRAVGTDDPFRFNPAAETGVEFAREALSSEQRSWLAALPEHRTVADGRCRIVHGHPDDPDRYTYPEDFGPHMLAGETALVLGHTHVQAAETFDDGLIVNPGSVGQPRDGDPRAAYAVIDLDDRTVDLHRVSYDIDAVIERVDAVGLPRSLGTRLRDGR